MKLDGESDWKEDREKKKEGEKIKFVRVDLLPSRSRWGSFAFRSPERNAECSGKERSILIDMGRIVTERNMAIAMGRKKTENDRYRRRK